MAAQEIELYRALVEEGPTLLWRTGADSRCIYVNRRWAAFTGRSLDEEVGDGWVAGVHPDDVTTRAAIHRRSFEGRRPFELEYRLRRFDGAYRYVDERAVPYTDPDGMFAGFIGSCVDVHNRHVHDVTVGDDFFAMSLDNLCVAGFDGYFKRVNPSWTRTLGWTAEELMSRPSAEFVHPDDLEATLAGRQRLRAGEALGQLVNRYRCKDGSYRWLEWRSVGHDERGLVYAAARDITDQKLAEQRLHEATVLQEKMQRQLIFSERMASVGTLAAGVAHEINNPLACVTANIAMLLEELESLEATTSSTRIAVSREMAMEARENAERIRKTVLELKTFARAENARPAVLELQPVLELSVHLASNELRHRANLVKDYGPTPPVLADEARLAQVFINLLVNAAQALPAESSDAHEIRIVTSTDASGGAVIEIRDTGPGISAAVIGRIFDPFFTTKPVGVGTGLGLSICHSLVTGMGGEITVLSAEGLGTTCRVALPAASARSVVVAPERAPKIGRACACVLVVDDERAVGMVLRRVLRDHDVTVVTTANEALELLAAGSHFDVILSDLMMPGMSGMAFYDELTRRFPAAIDRLVFVSGGAFTLEANAFLDRISNVRIEKPFDPRTVREIVERLIAQDCGAVS